MKKTKKSLLVSSLALILTLALTATSTFAWFNMRTSVNVEGFELEITTDTGFEVAVVLPTYAYDTEDVATITYPTIDATLLNYKPVITEADLLGVIQNKVFLAATLNRTTFNSGAGDLSYVDDNNVAITKFPLATDGVKRNVSHIEFKLYFRSASNKSIYVIDSANTYNSVDFDNALTAAEGVALHITDILEFDAYAAATNQATAYTTWKDGTKAEPFVFTTTENGYLAGTVTYVGSEYVLSLATLKARNPMSAYRIAFEAFKNSGGTKESTLVVDSGAKDKALLTYIDDSTALNNLGWIYYKKSLGIADDTNFKAPITQTPAATYDVVNPISIVETAGGAYGYSHTNVSIWLEGFDGETFASILGLKGKLSFAFTSVAPISTSNFLGA